MPADWGCREMSQVPQRFGQNDPEVMTAFQGFVQSCQMSMNMAQELKMKKGGGVTSLS